MNKDESNLGGKSNQAPEKSNQPGGQQIPHDGSRNANSDGNQITVQVRYQNETVSVHVNVNASLESLLSAAINETKNNSVPRERFQLKLGSLVLDPKGKIKDYGISEGALLVLVLLAGGGGNYKVV